MIEVSGTFVANTDLTLPISKLFGFQGRSNTGQIELITSQNNTDLQDILDSDTLVSVIALGGNGINPGEEVTQFFQLTTNNHIQQLTGLAHYIWNGYSNDAAAADWRFLGMIIRS